jgi:predicted nucleotidyltransferase
MRALPNNPDLRRVADVLARHPAVRAAFIFGSRARGTMREDSDLDLGIEGDPVELRAAKEGILTDLARVGVGRVDLVFLREAPPVLGHEVVKRNRVVFARSGTPVSTIFSNHVRRGLDMAPFVRVHATAYGRRLLDGQA